MGRAGDEPRMERETCGLELRGETHEVALEHRTIWRARVCELQRNGGGYRFRAIRRTKLTTEGRAQFQSSPWSGIFYTPLAPQQPSIPRTEIIDAVAPESGKGSVSA